MGIILRPPKIARADGAVKLKAAENPHWFWQTSTVEGKILPTASGSVCFQRGIDVGAGLRARPPNSTEEIEHGKDRRFSKN